MWPRIASRPDRHGGCRGAKLRHQRRTPVLIGNGRWRLLRTGAPIEETISTHRGCLSLKKIFLRLCLSLRALRERLAFHAKNAKSPQSRREMFRKLRNYPPHRVQAPHTGTAHFVHFIDPATPPSVARGSLSRPGPNRPTTLQLATDPRSLRQQIYPSHRLHITLTPSRAQRGKHHRVR